MLAAAHNQKSDKEKFPRARARNTIFGSRRGIPFMVIVDFSAFFRGTDEVTVIRPPDHLPKTVISPLGLCLIFL